LKIINAHVHMIELQTMLSLQPDLEISTDIAVFRDLTKTLSLTDPGNLLLQMAEAGISQSVLYACEAPIVFASNEYVAALCKQYPNEFIGFASVNPQREDAVEVIEKAIVQLGLKGMKFHPPLQNFYPNDRKVFPLYEKAIELNVPVVFHVGTTPFGSMVRLDQANPILLDDVACAFPELRIMLTHLGTLWHNESFMVVEKNPNVFIDTAAYIYEIEELLTYNLIERVGEDKFIFGTDYPMPFGGTMHKMKDFVECVERLELSDKIKEKIFFKNFEMLLKGKETKKIKAGDILHYLGNQ
jgi:uncharacterized protein